MSDERRMSDRTQAREHVDRLMAGETRPTDADLAEWERWYEPVKHRAAMWIFPVLIAEARLAARLEAAIRGFLGEMRDGGERSTPVPHDAPATPGERIWDRRLALLRDALEGKSPDAETIVGVAIRHDDGRVFTLPRPYRHHHLIRVMADLGEPTPIDGEQGFVTSTGRWMRRRAAGLLADANGQAKRTAGSHVGGDLFSEDLW